MRRRTLLAGVPAALFLGGCTELVTDGKAVYEADTAVVAEAALDETGYREEKVEEQVITEDLPAGRQIEVVNVMSEYKRRIELGPVQSGELARFTVLSTPQVKIAGRAMNPVKDMDNRELAEMLQEEYDDVSNVQHVDVRDVELQDQEVEMDRFSAEAVLQDGTDMEVYIHVAQTESEDDLLVALAVHPQEIDEQDRVDGMAAGVEHPQ